MSEENKAVDVNESATKISVDKDKYETSRTATGGKSLSNGDKVAKALEGMNSEEVYAVADNLIEGNDFRDKYAHLNVGMQRMNVGNRIRGFVGKRDKENEKIAEFNANLKEGVDAKPVLEDAGKLFDAAVVPVKEAVADRVKAEASLKADKEAAKEKAKAEKEAAKEKAKADKVAAKEKAESE